MHGMQKKLRFFDVSNLSKPAVLERETKLANP
jgi:hypothetical protein